MTWFAWTPRHEQPRRSADGMTGVYCQTCQREICRRANAQIRSVVKCAICLMREEGVADPEQYVIPQYFQNDPTKPPIPIGAEREDVFVNLFPEEKQDLGRVPSSGGVMGTAKSIYRALGFGKPVEPPPASKTTATKRRKKSTLFDE